MHSVINRPPEPARPLECPRCGYDVRGAAGWLHAPGDQPGDQCPLHGVCPECGLDFRWRDVLDESQGNGVRHFEGARRRSAWLFINTFLLLWRPWRLWREVQMHHPHRPWRLALLVVVSMLFVHLVIGAASRSAATAAYGYWLPRANIVWPYTQGGWYFDALSAVWSIPRSGQQFTLMVKEFVEGMKQCLDTATMPAEAQLGLLQAAMLPVFFVLLPITRRRCKVRWRHIARAMVYSLPLLPAIYLSTAWLMPVSYQVNRAASELNLPGSGSMLYMERVPISGAWLVTVAILFVWWRAVNRHYLRLPNATAVTVTMIVLANLALATFVIVPLALGSSWAFSVLSHLY